MWPHQTKSDTNASLATVGQAGKQNMLESIQNIKLSRSLIGSTAFTVCVG